MHKRVQWRQPQRWRAVRKAVVHFNWVFQHSCWCCEHEWVDSAEKAVWEARWEAQKS